MTIHNVAKLIVLLVHFRDERNNGGKLYECKQCREAFEHMKEHTVKKNLIFN
jgi:hypothetical protein